MEDALNQKRAAVMNVDEKLVRASAVLQRLAGRRRAETVCAVLLVLMAANLFASISRKSITNDEVVSIPAGYYHLAAGNFQISVDHPPFTKMVAALPLLFIQPNEPPITVRPGEDSQQRTLRTQEEFWSANITHFAAISFWSRVPMIALTLGLGLLIFSHTRQLFGARAAVLAVFLFSVEPNVLAHGRTVLNDLPAAFAYLLFFVALRAYLNKPDLRYALGLGLAGGFALVIKFSMIIVAPVFLIIAVASVWTAPRRSESRLRVTGRMGMAVLGALLLINATYFFHGQPLAQLEFPWVASIFPATLLRGAMFGMQALGKVIPVYLLSGVDVVLARNRYGQTASLLGASSDRGWWYYFPVAFALKTTIPFLLTSLAALIWSFWRLFAKREKLFLGLLIPLLIYLLISLTSHINIGIRHFLPVFPFLFILSGAFLDWLLRQQRARQATLILVVLLAGWTSIAAVRAFPDHMSYMNELTWRGPPWQYLSDSNIEWGDDVSELANYLRARGETKVRAALLGGWSTLPKYGVDYINLLVQSDVQLPETRYVAIGASFLNGSSVTINRPGQRRQDFFAEYRDRVPEAVFGKSIYLYREK